MVLTPFEKILGNTCELRIIEFFLPFENLELNVSQIADEVKVSRLTAGRVVKKFVDWNILKKNEESVPLYSLNKKSHIVKSIKLFNAAILEEILGPEEVNEINDFISESGSISEISEKFDSSNEIWKICKLNTTNSLEESHCETNASRLAYGATYSDVFSLNGNSYQGETAS